MDSGGDHSELGVDPGKRAAQKRWAGHGQLRGGGGGVPGPWEPCVGTLRARREATGVGLSVRAAGAHSPQRQGARGLPVRLGAGSLKSAVP